MCVVVVCDRDRPIYENFYPFRSQICFLVSVLWFLCVCVCKGCTVRMWDGKVGKSEVLEPNRRSDSYTVREQKKVGNGYCSLPLALYMVNLCETCCRE